MNNSIDFESKRKRFLMYLIQMDEAMVDYVSRLKKKSSEELLSGSTEFAKNCLDEILMLESNTNDLQRLISNIVNFVEKNKDTQPFTKFEQNTSDTVNKKAGETNNKKSSDVDIQFEDLVEKTERPVEITVKRPKNTDSKIPILKSLIYLGGIANEEEINKYMEQYIGRNGDGNISINELRISLDSMIETEMISVDPLDENIEILQRGIDYLAKSEV